MAEDIGSITGPSAGTSGQTSSALNLGADLAAETITPTEREKAVFRSLMADTFMSTPDDFVTWVLDQIVLRGSPVSISQIQGFTSFRPQFDVITTQETSTSTTYNDLATQGPEITGLSNGEYLVLYGATARNNTAGQNSLASLIVNGVDLDHPVSVTYTDFISVARAVVTDISGTTNNYVRMRYKVTGGTGTWNQRWLAVIKTNNS